MLLNMIFYGERELNLATGLHVFLGRAEVEPRGYLCRGKQSLGSREVVFLLISGCDFLGLDMTQETLLLVLPCSKAPWLVLVPTIVLMKIRYSSKS